MEIVSTRAAFRVLEFVTRAAGYDSGLVPVPCRTVRTPPRYGTCNYLIQATGF